MTKRIISSKGKNALLFSVLTIMLILFSINISAETINCYPVSAEYNTGTVNNSGTITQTSEIWEVGGDGYRGWSKFDVSAIPVCAIINNVELHLYFNSINWPYFYWYRLDNDPLTLIGNPSAIYADCGDGAEYLYYGGASLPAGWYSNTLGGSAVTDLQSALTDDWFGIGHKTGDNSSTWYYHADGWNEANPPYLTITYEVLEDYFVSITPEEQTGSGVPDSDVWYALTVINQGAMNDTYDLSVTGNLWNTTIWDETGSTQISTLYLNSGNSAGIRICVEIPIGATGQDNVLVFATSQAEPAVEDSASITTIADAEPPTVEVIEPNGGESWGTFEWYTITWTADDNVGVVGDSVYYSINAGTDWMFIISHTGNPQSYSWQIPNTPSEECLVKVKVFDASSNYAEDISDDNFTIFYQELPVINGDFETGDFSNWTVTGPHSADVVQHQGSWCGHIHIGSGHASGGGTPNDQWEMVSQSIFIPGVADSLNFYMEVYGSSWHNGGHVWIMDADSIGIYTHLYYTGGGGGSGQSYPWEYHQVNIESWAGHLATIYFAGQNSNGFGDHQCDIYFDNISVTPIVPDTIPPTVTVDIPDGGEVWTVGETHQIQWTAEDDMGIRSDSVFYSIDNGFNWIFIVAHTGDPQSCNWTIPDTPSTQCLVKVVVYDGGNNSAVDESDAVFTIAADTSPPTVEVIEPNGGEDWGTFEWHTITWTADDNVGVIGDSVYYSTNNGADWTFLTSHTGNPQSYSWQIPNTPSEECLVKVKVIDASGNCAEDISDGNFIISYVEPPPLTYAVVIKQSTYNEPDWQAVADALLARYGGQLFIWNSSLSEVQEDVALYHPSHIGFICDVPTATPSFIQSSVWPFTRALDDDVYCDATWGIITGYNAQDALNLVSGPTGFEVKTCLGGTSSCNVNYFTQGIATNEATYGMYYVKYPDSLETTTHTDGPTDRTEWLVTMINEGIDIFNYDPVDIFYTSGHGGHNIWQLHYPSSGQEGYFRSSNGQVYGDPHSGPDININSENPKIYFGLGNCNIGQIQGGGSMAPSWIHTGAAYQYTGYLIGEGGNSCQHGGTKAYFYKVARHNTWAESYFLANIALQFDIINNTPGANPPDLNGSALYGDPGMDIKMSNEGVFMTPLFTNELTINEGTEKDTVTFKITMNREGNPGFTSKWGERHPAIILPFIAENIEIISTDAMAVVVEDNFALMYIWYQGQPPLPEGETREVIFTCNHIVVDVDEPILPGAEIDNVILYQNHPNPFSIKDGNLQTVISYSLPKTSKLSLRIYNIKGQLIETLVDDVQQAGYHSAVWNAKHISSGIYFYRITAGEFKDIKKCIILK